MQAPPIITKRRKPATTWIVIGAFLVWGVLGLLAAHFFYRHFRYGWDMAEGKRLYREQRYAEAKGRFLAARYQVETADVDSYIGACAFHTKDYPLAEQMFQAAIDRLPNVANAYIWLGYVYVVEKKLDLAETPLREGLLLDPKSAPAYVDLGMLYHYRKKDLAAADCFMKAIHVQPNDIKANRWLATIYLEHNMWKQAEPVEHRILELDPYQGSAYYGLALIAESRKDYAQAATFLNQGLAVEPSSKILKKEQDRISSKKDPFDP